MYLSDYQKSLIKKKRHIQVILWHKIVVLEKRNSYMVTKIC